MNAVHRPRATVLRRESWPIDRALQVQPSVWYLAKKCWNRPRDNLCCSSIRPGDRETATWKTDFARSTATCSIVHRAPPPHVAFGAVDLFWHTGAGVGEESIPSIAAVAVGIWLARSAYGYQISRAAESQIR